MDSTTREDASSKEGGCNGILHIPKYYVLDHRDRTFLVWWLVHHTSSLRSQRSVYRVGTTNTSCRHFSPPLGRLFMFLFVSHVLHIPSCVLNQMLISPAISRLNPWSVTYGFTLFVGSKWPLCYVVD